MSDERKHGKKQSPLSSEEQLAHFYLQPKWTTKMWTPNTHTHTQGPLMCKHNSVAIISERGAMLDRLQLLNVNYSVLRHWGDNELAPGDSSDTSFNESRGNLWNLRSGTMRRYWLVRRSPAHPPFVLMKADTHFFLLFACFHTFSSKVLLFISKSYKTDKLGCLIFSFHSFILNITFCYSYKVGKNNENTHEHMRAEDKHGVILQIIPWLDQKQPETR